MILFVFKTDQDKRALKYKFDEEKLPDFFPPSVMISCEKRRVRGWHSCLAVQQGGNTSPPWERAGSWVELLLDSHCQNSTGLVLPCSWMGSGMGWIH